MNHYHLYSTIQGTYTCTYSLTCMYICISRVLFFFWLLARLSAVYRTYLIAYRPSCLYFYGRYILTCSSGGCYILVLMFWPLYQLLSVGSACSSRCSLLFTYFKSAVCGCAMGLTFSVRTCVSYALHLVDHWFAWCVSLMALRSGRARSTSLITVLHARACTPLSLYVYICVHACVC